MVAGNNSRGDRGSQQKHFRPAHGQPSHGVQQDQRDELVQRNAHALQEESTYLDPSLLNANGTQSIPGSTGKEKPAPSNKHKSTSRSKDDRAQYDPTPGCSAYITFISFRAYAYIKSGWEFLTRQAPNPKVYSKSELFSMLRLAQATYRFLQKSKDHQEKWSAGCQTWTVHCEGSTRRGGGDTQDNEGAREKEGRGKRAVPLHSACGDQGLEETHHGA
eukprot:3940904-Rhodomonas_salina.1